MVLCDFKKATQMCHSFSSTNPQTLFFLSSFCNQMMCGCGSVACTQCAKGEGWGVLWNGQKAGGLSLRVKRDERVGVWWLDGVDVSVMAWCQTLCHCQCQPHQPIPQWSATVQCVSKPLCCCHFKQCVCAAVLLHFCPFFVQSSFSLTIVILLLFAP